MEKFTVDFYIDKFEKIPEELWCSFKQIDSEGRKCAYGHCNPSYSDCKLEESIRLNQIDEEFSKIFVLTPVNPKSYLQRTVLADVNNGIYREYQQPTPKQRILAALRDIKAMQSSEQNVQESDTTEDAQGGNAGKQKEKIRYVKVSKEIEEMELVEN